MKILDDIRSIAGMAVLRLALLVLPSSERSDLASALFQMLTDWKSKFAAQSNESSNA